jgi:hypothetical protein
MRDPALLKFLFRDGAIILATGALWAFVDGAGVAFQVFVAVMTALCGYLVHEWGHLFGCWFRRSRVEIPARATSLFLFNFDVGCNDRRQFNAMAMGGFIASTVYVILLAMLLPLELLAGKVAMALAVIGVAATFIFEVPTAWRVFRGAPLPRQGPAFVSTLDTPKDGYSG